MATFIYQFSELPLIIANGVEGALTNGQAEIEFDRDGTWEVNHIWVDGYRNASKEEIAKGSRPFVSDLALLPAGNELDFLISQRLVGEWHGRVQDAVREQLEVEHEAAA